MYCRIYPEKLLTINNAELGVKLGNFELVKERDREREGLLLVVQIL